MKKTLATLSAGAAGALPLVAFAQNEPNITYIEGLLNAIQNILGFILPILIAFAVIYFIWNVVWYVVAGNEEAKAQAKARIGYGLIGLVVIIGIWGLVTILVNVLGVSTTEEAPPIPELPTGSIAP